MGEWLDVIRVGFDEADVIEKQLVMLPEVPS